MALRKYRRRRFRRGYRRRRIVRRRYVRRRMYRRRARPLLSRRLRFWARKKRNARRAGRSKFKVAKSFYRDTQNWVQYVPNEEGTYFPRRLSFFEVDPDRYWVSSDASRDMYDMGMFNMAQLKKISWNFYGFHLFERTKYDPKWANNVDNQNYWSPPQHEREIPYFTLYYYHDYQNATPRWIKEFGATDPDTGTGQDSTALSMCKRKKIRNGKGHISGSYRPRCRNNMVVSTQEAISGCGGAYGQSWYNWEDVLANYAAPANGNKSHNMRGFLETHDDRRIGTDRVGGAECSTSTFVDQRPSSQYFSMRHYFTVDHPTAGLYVDGKVGGAPQDGTNFVTRTKEIYLVYNVCIRTTWYLMGYGDIELEAACDARE